jgi:hypothetical protein
MAPFLARRGTNAKQLNDLVVQPVVDEVGIAMDEIDDLVLVDQPPKCGRVLTILEFSLVVVRSDCRAS